MNQELVDGISACFRIFETSSCRTECEHILMAALLDKLEQLRHPEAPARNFMSFLDLLRATTYRGEAVVPGEVNIDDVRVAELDGLFDRIKCAVGQIVLTPEILDEPQRLSSAFDDAALRFNRRSPRNINATPPELARLIAKLLEPKFGEKVYDPACGLGKCLLAMGCESDGKVELHGQEFSPFISALCKINLRFHGFDEAVIACGDTLDRPACGDMRFDVIVSEPPVGTLRLADERYTSRFETQFIQHILGRLNETGRAAVLVPYTFLYNSQPAFRELRAEIVARNLLDAIIMLPPKALFNTGVQTFVVVFRADRGDQKDVCLINVANEEHYERVIGRNVLTHEAIDEIVKAYRTRTPHADFACVCFDDLAKDDNRSFDHAFFAQKEEADLRPSIPELKIRVKEIESELAQVQAKLEW